MTTAPRTEAEYRAFLVAGAIGKALTDVGFTAGPPQTGTRFGLRQRYVTYTNAHVRVAVYSFDGPAAHITVSDRVLRDVTAYEVSLGLGTPAPMIAATAKAALETDQ